MLCNERSLGQHIDGGSLTEIFGGLYALEACERHYFPARPSGKLANNACSVISVE